MARYGPHNDSAITYTAAAFLRHHRSGDLMGRRLARSYLTDLKNLLAIDPMGPPFYLPMGQKEPEEH